MDNKMFSPVEDQKLNMTLEEIIQLEREKRFIKNVSEVPAVQPTVKFDLGVKEDASHVKVRTPSPQISTTFESNFYHRNQRDRGLFNRVHFHPYKHYDDGFQGNWSRGYNRYRGSRMKNVGGYGSGSWRGRDNSPYRHQHGNRRYQDFGKIYASNDRNRRSISVCSNDSRRSTGSNLSLNSNYSNRSQRSRGSNWSLNSYQSYSSGRGNGGNNNGSWYRRKWNQRRHRWFPNNDITAAIKQTIEQFHLDRSSCKLLKVGNVSNTVIIPRTCDMNLNERFRYLCCH